MTAEMPWIAAELDALAAAGLQRRRREVRPLPNGACEIDGRRLWNFAGNDYLGLAHNPRVIAAAQAALAECGVGARASALITGRSPWHVRLEKTLARFEGQPAAVLFPTGYAANVGTIAALAGDADIIFSDRLNHASLIDGCRISGAKVSIYRHTELEVLERALHKAAGYRRRLIVTDGVFSMDGDVAPLRELCDLAERFDVAVLVDEAHGTGVFGEHGRGACELCGVEDRVAVRVGTLSKAIGTLGGFVTGPQSLIDWLWNKARPQFFSTALPPAICAAACVAVELIERDPDIRQRVWHNIDFVRRELTQRGVHVLSGSVGSILPIVLGTPDAALEIHRRLDEQGILVAAIRPPTVPSGTSRLRVTISAGHEQAGLTVLVDALAATIQTEIQICNRLQSRRPSSC